MNTPPPHPSSDAAEASIPKPRWLVLTTATAAFALLFAFAIAPRTALFWYVFPLFGLGGCYLVEFRSEFPTRWKVALAASGVLSAVARALDWPFSGHVLWNVLFIGHAWTTGKRRTSWMTLMLVSLLHLVAMKIAFQTSRDVAGAVAAIAVAAIALFVLEGRESVAG
jgi:hypothetical protein